MLQLGSVVLNNRVILAPMAGVTDPPFRKIVRTYHPGLVCGEMISAQALHYNSQKTRHLMWIDPEEKPVSMQLFGSQPEVMAEAAVMVEAAGADLIDLNMGCPVPKVVKNGEGAALLTNLPLAGLIIREVAQSVKVPVTVKFRLGWDHQRIVAPDLARIAEDCGAAAVTVHARTRDQFYQGAADWDWIRLVKQRVSIPVIGNGDVNSPRAASAMVEQTGCDGVMIGQAALGRPWLFGRVVAFLEKGELIPEPSLEEQFRVIGKHLQLQVRYSGEERGIKEMRKHLAWYLRGIPGSARMRDLLNNITSFKVLEETLRDYTAGLGVRSQVFEEF